MKRMAANAMLLFLCWSFFPASAQAHKVNVFAWVEGDTVHTESKFGGGRMVKDGRISVLDDEGNVLLEGVTDDAGAFSFKVPKMADLTIVMDAGSGHRNSWRIMASELEGGVPGDARNAVAVLEEESSKSSGGTALSVASGLSAQAVEEIVARQLEEKLRPLNRMMAESRDRGPTLGDIFGGVGYLLGLVGLGAYIRFRKERGRA